MNLHIISHMVGGMSQVTGDGNKSNSLENILVVGGVSLHISYMVGGMSSGWRPRAKFQHCIKHENTACAKRP